MLESIVIAVLAAAPVQASAYPGGGSTRDQVAEAVAESFPSHDTDGDGKLSRGEFAAWMVALKRKSDPRTKADAPATKAWVAGAFKLADRDGNAAVTAAELTRFLKQSHS